MSLDNQAEMLKNIHAARGEFYAFLSRLFSNVPDIGLYQMLTDMSPKLQILMESTDNEEIKTGAKGILDFLEIRSALSGKERTLFELERSRHYTYMFCLPSSIPVDESIYTSIEHKEREESYAQMIALFKKYGFGKINRISENDDFVGYELLFMSKLAYDCADFIEAGKTEEYQEWLKAQHDLHIDHFDRWIYDFFNTVVRYDKIEGEILYKYFAYLGRGFLREDKITLEELAV